MENRPRGQLHLVTIFTVHRIGADRFRVLENVAPLQLGVESGGELGLGFSGPSFTCGPIMGLIDQNTVPSEPSRTLPMPARSISVRLLSGSARYAVTSPFRPWQPWRTSPWKFLSVLLVCGLTAGYLDVLVENGIGFRQIVRCPRQGKRQHHGSADGDISSNVKTAHV